MTKKYGKSEYYERKLERVMERLGVEKFNFNWDRFGSWVDFTYKGEQYRFGHSIENAQKHGVNLTSGSDTFAQIVLSLEDLAKFHYIMTVDIRLLIIADIINWRLTILFLDRWVVQMISRICRHSVLGAT